MTTSTTAPAAVSTDDLTTATGTAPSPSPEGRADEVRPRVVRSRPSRRLVALIVAAVVAGSLGLAVVATVAAHQEVSPAPAAAPAVGPAVVGDASHGGPGSRADAVRFSIPPRADDQAVLAHGGAGRVVTESGVAATQLP